ncbi:MAG: twin-arginine translocation signal domain-containing protein [Planctomycetaceae bacterium]|nr:twin-arginine translocation signal domain-containing protein [Planctomycetaceae bacterium]
MLKKFESLAQQAATKASRRDFLRGLGKAAAGAAMVAAGVLATSSSVIAGGKATPHSCCNNHRAACPKPNRNCIYVGCIDLTPEGIDPNWACVWDCAGVENVTGCQ